VGSASSVSQNLARESLQNENLGDVLSKRQVVVDDDYPRRVPGVLSSHHRVIYGTADTEPK
jgi:hypothetical protein